MDRFSKRNINHEAIRQSFSFLRSDCGSAQFIYTDGSKTADGVGSAFYTNNESHSWTLHPMSSVYFAEQYAIWQALLYCAVGKSSTRVMIVTDSRSTLQSLAPIYAKDPITRNIKVDVTFVWTPSHVGIEGNECADQAAYQAAHNSSQDLCLLKRADALRFVNQKLVEKWQEMWSNKNTKLKIIHPCINASVPTHEFQMTRQERTKVTRLRIGHTLHTHGYLLRGEQQPICVHCREPLTVTHIICECSAYRTARINCNIGPELKDNLCGFHDIKNTIRFLKEINVYKLI